MQTPTTTTRENSGAPSMISSITPGTPTHSKITGCFGVAAPSLSARRHACHQPTGRRRSFSTEPTASSSAEGRSVRCPRPGAAVYGDALRRVDHDVGAARGGERAAPGREVARDDRAHALRLQQQDDREPDRPAADRRSPRCACRPRRGARRARRRPSARSARRRPAAGRSAPAASATPRRAAARRRRRARAPTGRRASTPPPPRSSGSATTGVPVGEPRRQPGPCSATSPQNSWPKTTGSSDRAKRS